MTSPICSLCGSTSSEHVFAKNEYELRRCHECDLVFVANPPTVEELSRFYSAAAGYHNQFADENYDVTPHFDRARAGYRLVERFAQPPGRLLDIGCTAGFFLEVAQKKGWEPVGLELSADTAEIARQRYGLEVHCGVLQEDTFEPESFDVVTMWDVIEHVPDPLETARLVHRILKKGGYFIFETPNIDGLFPRVSFRFAKRLDFWPHPEPPAHLFQFSEKTVRKLMDESGFDTAFVKHERIPVAYSLGDFRSNVRSPKRLAYAAMMGPLAVAGPWMRRGDTLKIVARKP